MLIPKGWEHQHILKSKNKASLSGCFLIGWIKPESLVSAEDRGMRIGI